MATDYDFIPYYANSAQQVKYPHDSLAFALESMEDGEGAGDFLHSVYFTTDPNVVVVAPKNGPFTTPPSKQQERFTLKRYSLEIEETFDGGQTWEPPTWVDEDIVGGDANAAADFIREWIVWA